MKPGVGDTSWSTDIISPGLVAVLSSFQCFWCFLLHCWRISFEKRHALQVGMLYFSRRLGLMFSFSIFEIWKMRCGQSGGGIEEIQKLLW